MRILLVYLSLILITFGKTPIIKVEGTDLLKALAYTENNPYTPMYDWDIGNPTMSPIIWDPDGNNWSPKGFERKGKVYLTNNGKITHTVIDTDTKPGYWTLSLLGNRDRIIQATLIPNKVTLENPAIVLDKALLKEQVVCEENDKLKQSVYRIKFPKKVSFWMEEKQSMSTQGNKSTYVITFDKKPECATTATVNKKNNSNNLQNSTKDQINLFIKMFYKTGEESSPSKVLPYYASSVDRYFSIKNANKEDILTDKIRYYKKWPIRNYILQDIEIMDTYIEDGIQYYVISTEVAWSVTSKKGKKVSNTSHNIITLMENDNGYLIKSIKTIGDAAVKETKSNTKKISSRHSSMVRNEPKEKTISFNENGIKIHLTYPRSVRAGESFRIKASMTNNTRSAKQGGLTLSFPDMISMGGQVLKNNFSILKGYSSPDKIYNKDTRKNMRTKYFMVEGWHNKTWSYGKTKYFSVELTAPQYLDQLRVNLRGVLWIKNKHDLREIPSRSSIYDQQGFAVKRFSINIR